MLLSSWSSANEFIETNPDYSYLLGNTRFRPVKKFYLIEYDNRDQNNQYGSSCGRIRFIDKNCSIRNLKSVHNKIRNNSTKYYLNYYQNSNSRKGFFFFNHH